MVEFDEELQCHVQSVEHHPGSTRAVLRIRPGECADMDGTIHRIRKDAPWVRHIDVIAGSFIDTSYRLLSGRWIVSISPPHHD
jgi:hypothetical protein